MQKKITIYFVLLTAIIVGSSNVSSTNNSGAAPVGNTGVTSDNCQGCHNTSAINSGGGSITVNGLPSSGYIPGQAYPFSITINHPTNRARWGFAIKAVNAANTNAATGTFTTTNPNARVASSELGHSSAPSFSGTSYTFNNLTWTAPTGASAPANIRFFYIGNAANGSGSTGDFIYSNSTGSIFLPIILTNFSVEKNANSNTLIWKVENNNDTKFFEVERSSDNEKFTAIAKINSNSTSNSYSYKDENINRTFFYRLKMTDKNGLVNYSKILSSVNKNNDNKVFNVYPNPVKKGQSINIEVISSENQEVTFTLVNLQGKILSSKVKSLNEGFSRISLNYNSFIPSGSYYLIPKIKNNLLTPIQISITE